MKIERKLISFDWAIKNLLRNKANFEILEGFLSELLMEDMKIEGILESETNKSTEKEKSNRVDLVVKNSKEELIIIEIQHETEYDYLHRILFGTSRLLSENMEKGMAYSKIKKIISISIVYFDLGVGEDYIYKGTTNFVGLNKKDTLILNQVQQELYGTEKISDIFPEYYIIKVNCFDDVLKSGIDEWTYFLKHEEIKDEFKGKGLRKAKEELDIMKLSEEERREYGYYMESLRYEASMVESSYGSGKLEGKKEGIIEGKKEGIIEGKKEGEKQKAFEIAKNLIDEGLTIESVSKLTGLSKEDIEGL
jgi:predicted transposase/invertase (TIGR01784 family)